MARTLSQILINSNSYLDLEAAEPTSDDLTVRTDYAQQAVREWADAYRWPELSTPSSVFLTTATITLVDFKELEDAPVDLQGEIYPQIRPGDRIYKESSDKYCFITGNEQSGFILTVNGLSANATLSLTYQRQPSNMATLSDICEVPDDQFVVQKIVSQVLQSRSDERFPQVEANAQRLLANMIGRAMVQSGPVRRRGSAAWAIGKARG